MPSVGTNSRRPSASRMYTTDCGIVAQRAKSRSNLGDGIVQTVAERSTPRPPAPQPRYVVQGGPKVKRETCMNCGTWNDCPGGGCITSKDAVLSLLREGCSTAWDISCFVLDAEPILRRGRR